jgi:hypothetical protein
MAEYLILHEISHEFTRSSSSVPPGPRPYNFKKLHRFRNLILRPIGVHKT